MAKKGMKMKERRKYVRFPIITNVKYSLATAPNKENSCLSKDFSGAGINILVRKKIAIGKMINLSFYLPPDPKPVKAQGKVIWSKKAKQGKIETGIRINYLSRKIIEP